MNDNTSSITRNPQRNLGTYSNVLEQDELWATFLETAQMNFVDKAAYPEVTAMEQTVVRFLASAMNGDTEVTGFATTGSSEAITLALAWHQRNFIARHPEKDGRLLNFVISEGYHKSFEKFAVLFGVELRAIPLGTDLRADTKAAAQLVDDNTFCIVGIAGSTELGMVDDIPGLNEMAHNHSIPMHIDAAAGGYVLPFTGHSHAWDFALPSVQTINISAHKYGLCLPGVGFLLTRNRGVMPANYSGTIEYLSGGCIEDHALSCTRNASFVVNAFHNSQKYGHEGYKAIAKQNYENADHLARGLADIGDVTRVTKGDLPVVTFSHADIQGISHHLAKKGWIQAPHTISPLKRRCIRIVVRRHVTREMIDELLGHMAEFSLLPAPVKPQLIMNI